MKNQQKCIHNIHNVYMHIFAGTTENSIILIIILLWGSVVLTSYNYPVIYMSYHNVFRTLFLFI